jgi:hypothetical protein
VQTKIIQFDQNQFYKSDGIQNISFTFEADYIKNIDLHWQSVSSYGRTQPKFTFNCESKLLTILIPVGLVTSRSYLEVSFSSLSYIRDEKINKILGDE